MNHMVVGQNLRCLFGDGYHSTVVVLEGFLGVHRRTGILTHSHITFMVERGLLFPLNLLSGRSPLIAQDLSWLLTLDP